MYHNDFKGLPLSGLGFGTMRLPMLDDGKTIDQEQVQTMVDYAMAHGVNYFDTAYPYHGGKSETSIGEALSKYPRESWYLADKYPGHQHFDVFDPAGIFEDQLKKCGVEYFDFYLYHNICENSLDDYMNPKWGILDYFVEQKRLGRIRHLGFSCHASAKNLEKILDGPYGKVAEFVQIQLNYLDWTLQDAKEKVRMLRERGIPVWVMEPVRGGKLARLPESDAAALEALKPGMSQASWAFRWLQGIDGIGMILSGMSDFDQMKDNVATFDQRVPLDAEGTAAVEQIAEKLKSGVPCTACRYCCDVCPQGLDIPTLMGAWNDLSFETSFTPIMMIEGLSEEKRPASCLGCGACTHVCPQGIDIPGTMAKLAERYDASPKWSAICKERNAISSNRG